MVIFFSCIFELYSSHPKAVPPDVDVGKIQNFKKEEVEGREFELRCVSSGKFRGNVTWYKGTLKWLMM